MSDKLGLSNELKQLDNKGREFYDDLSDEERKKFSTYLMLRYSASSEGSSELQEWYLRATNERVNINFFDINQHPKLQWLCCTTASPGLGSQRHYWLAHKKKDGSNNKAIKFLTKLYPHLKEDEIELMASINDVKALKELARDMGMTDQDIKRDLG